MLIKLTGEQVSKHWQEVIKPAIEISMPSYVDVGDDTMNVVLSKILSDSLQCWLVQDDGVVVGICTTQVSSDELSGTKSLIIYSLHSMKEQSFGDHLWTTCMGQLQKFARKHNCANICCYTDNDVIIARAKESNGAFTQQFIIFNLIE